MCHEPNFSLLLRGDETNNLRRFDTYSMGKNKIKILSFSPSPSHEKKRKQKRISLILESFPIYIYLLI
jgi:hypothetical protein